MPKIDIMPDSPRSTISEYATPRSFLDDRPVSIGTPDPRIPSPKAGAIAMNATPVADSCIYKYDKEEMIWGGKRYRLTLEVPLEKRRSEYSDAELEACAKAFAQQFLKDLKKRLDAQASCPIHAGQNFKVLFDAQGYVAFTPRANASSFTRKEIIEHCPHVNAQDEPARELSQIIEQKSPQKILDQLKTRKSFSFSPIGLVNLGVQCFANTAFQQWVTNPILRKELLTHPEYLKDGEQNPLYLALQGYIASSRPYDLRAMLQKLNIDIRLQDDTDVVVNALRDQLDFTKIPQTSPLYAQITKTMRLDGEWVPANQEPPSIGYRYLHLTPDKTLADLIEEQCVAEGDNKPMRGHNNKKLEQQKEVFDRPPGILSIYMRRNKTQDEKDNTPIQIHSLQVHLSKNVCGEETDYELMSYGLHLGETPKGGHWVTYFRESEKFFMASDEKVQEVNEQDFLTYAPLASSFVLNRKDP